MLLASGFIVGLILHLFGMSETNTISGALTLDTGESSEFKKVSITLNPVGQLIGSLLLIYPAIAVCLKRRHDRNSVGYDLLVFVGLGLAMRAMTMSGSEAAITIANVLSVVMSLVILYFLVVLGFLRGDTGSNAYGPDPLAKKPDE